MVSRTVSLLTEEEMFYFDRPDLVILRQFEHEPLCPHEICAMCVVWVVIFIVALQLK